ncbi:MAG: hypothetical protein ACRDZW_06655 [Acidimicrobiales bacterium]
MPPPPAPTTALDVDGPRPVAASDLVAACEAAWQAIQQRHPALPDTVVVLGSGIERGRLVKLGHWWGGPWRVGDQTRGEVLLAGEALHLPPEAVFEVLLHEAAHGLNAARGVRDASRGGRYHNQHYRTAAAEVGLRPRRMDPYGWARTELTPAASETYRESIERIGTEMRLARGLPAPPGIGVEGGRGGTDNGTPGGEEANNGEREQRPKQRAAECGCAPARKLRMAPSVLALGPVVCGLCGDSFDVPGAELSRPERAAGAARGVVDASFVARRGGALAAEQVEERRAEGAAHLDRIAAAIAAVAPEVEDGALMAQAFADARAEIARWFEAVAATETEPSALRGDSELDLRTVTLPGFDPVGRAGAEVDAAALGIDLPPLPERLR